MMRWKVMLVVAALCTEGGLSAACHHGAPRVQQMIEPEAQLERALTLFRRGDFRRAQTLLQRATFEMTPGQPEMAEARYYLAECYFQAGDRVQAAAEFRKVADEFPASPYAPLALLRAGDSNLRMWRRAELDPTYGETALAIYQELSGRYPDTDAAARARPHVIRLENQFAEKTYKNGMFYLKRKAYDSAIIYFKDVIANFPNARRAPDALLRLVDSYRAIRYTQELQETCVHLRRFYPHASGLDRSCPATADTTATPS
jgi:outer membrane protein assembly factor BamD